MKRVVLALLAVLLKRTNPDMALQQALAISGAELDMLAAPLGEIRDIVTQLSDWGGLPTELFAPLVKTVGIALVSRTGSDLCKDAGEGAMASLVETAGAVTAILVSLPLFQAAWDMLRSLL